jgi:uncharacterized membrane protein
MWIVFSLLASLGWASASAIDKYLMSKRKLDPFFVLFVLCSLDFIVGLAFSFHFRHSLSIELLYGFFLGMLIPIVDYLYFKSIKQDEVSRVVPWFELSVVMVAIGGAIFLGEILEFRQYLGIIIVLFSLWLITIKDKLNIKIDRWVWLMILASFFNALTTLTEKYLLHQINPFQLFGVIGLGSLIGFVPFLFWKWPIIKSGLQKQLKELRVISLSEISGLAAILLTILALNSGYAVLVGVFSSFSYLFLFVITIMMTVFKPSIIKENISKKFLILKLVAIILIIYGVYLINN